MTEKDKQLTPEELTVVEQQAELIQKQEAALKELEARVEQLQNKMEADETEGKKVDKPDADVFEDFDMGGKALDFKQEWIEPDEDFPMGRKLQWCGNRMREEYGMAGWTAVKLGDPFLIKEEKDPKSGKVQRIIGGKLSQYLHAPPPKMDGSAKRDDYIRRGDVFLAWMDMRQWIAKEQRAAKLAQRKRLVAADQQDHINVKGRKGASVIGPGLTQTNDPKQGLQSGPTVHGLHASALPKDIPKDMPKKE